MKTDGFVSLACHGERREIYGLVKVHREGTIYMPNNATLVAYKNGQFYVFAQSDWVFMPLNRLSSTF